MCIHASHAQQEELAPHRNFMVRSIPGRMGGDLEDSGRNLLKGIHTVENPSRVLILYLYVWPSSSSRTARYGLPSPSTLATSESQSCRSPQGPPHSQMPDLEKMEPACHDRCVTTVVSGMCFSAAHSCFGHWCC